MLTALFLLLSAEAPVVIHFAVDGIPCFFEDKFITCSDTTLALHLTSLEAIAHFSVESPCVLLP